MVRSARRTFEVGVCAVGVLIAAAVPSWRVLAQAPEPAKGVKYAQISPTDMKEWLTYLSSDELQGRQVFTEGYGLAAAYVADRLQQWGVKPLGDDGTYFENVKLKGYRVTRNSTVDVTVNGQPTTFKQGEHVTFGVNSGGHQTLAFTGAEFIGYGTPADLQGRDLKGKLVVVMPNLVAAGGAGRGRGRAGGPAALAVAAGAGAVVTFSPAPTPPSAAETALVEASDALAKAQAAVQQAEAQLPGRSGGRAGGFGAAGGGRGALPTADITTVQKVDNPVTPAFTGDEAFFEALFAGGPVKFADIAARAQKGDPLQALSLPVRVSVKVDNTFEVVSERLTRNVVGLIEGADPKLKDTYVMFGAHLDHIGYSETGGGAQPSPSGCRSRSQTALDALAKAGKQPQKTVARGGGAAGGGRAGAPAMNSLPFDQRDFINNGADDDGSGSTAELAIAKAFALGPKPKRSVVFVWHTGEEAGLYGSRYNADFPVVPLDKVQAQLNMDMVGRDDCDDVEGDYSNSVFVVGDDRISTDLHNLIVETDATMTKPVTLDYELNDPADPEGVYTRSDHYSYAAKGIPIAFFTTGLHPDYHRVSDTVDKILFPKMARIAQLVYQTGFAIADTDRVLVRDNKGPRAGFGSKAEIIK
jgi:hypothetical protein